MQQLILVRQELESLNEDEFVQCVNLMDREYITRMIFKQLFDDLTKNKMNNIQLIKSTIAKMKQFRITQQSININNNNDNDDDEDIDIEQNNDNDKDKKPPSIKLDELPDIILSEISSYITFSDQLQFEKCNRSILIGSRSSRIPTHSINDNQFTKLVTFCNENKSSYLPKLRLFKSVQINCDHVTKYNEDYKEYDDVIHKFNDFNLFKYIQELEIWNGDRKSTDIILSHLNEYNDFSNIKTLRFLHGGYEDDIDLKLLNGNKLKLEYFELARWFDRNDVILSNDEWIEQLKGIAINNLCYDEDEDNMMIQIYSAMSDNLESLHKGYSIITDDINGKLNKLKEICLPWNSSKSQIKMLLKQNMNHLKRIHFGEGPENKIFDEETMILWMNKIIKTIQYISLNANNIKHTFLDILIKTMKNMNKNRLKIRMNGLRLNDIETLEQLTDILNSKCLNWMIICYDLKWFGSDNKWNMFIQSIKEKYCVINKSKPRQNDNKYCCHNFVILNKGGNIAGYQENWIMKCQACQQDAVFD